MAVEQLHLFDRNLSEEERQTLLIALEEASKRTKEVIAALEKARRITYKDLQMEITI